MLSRSEMATLAQRSALGGRLIRGFSRVTPGAFLSRTELENLLAGAVRSTVIAGGAAGDHTVTGIETGDALRAVLFIDATDASETYSDLTSEFSISAADTINNGGGTDTSGGALIVVYEDLTP